MLVTALQPVKLIKRAVDLLHVSSGDPVIWDRDLPGFGVRVRGPSGKPKRKALGRDGEVTSEKLRRDAVVVIDRIKRGLPPGPPPERPEPTLADLVERHMEFHVRVHCKPRTISSKY